MAKLNSIIDFTGTLDELQAYRMKGVDRTILRRKPGPKRRQVKTSPNFKNSRRCYTEFGGRSTTAGLIMQALQPLKLLADFNAAGRLNSELRPIQKADTVGEWGQRHVQLSLNPQLLEGFSLTRELPLEAVVRTPFRCTISKEGLRATVSIPQLLPGVTFFPPAGFPLYQVAVVLGAVPDVFFTRERGYAPPKDRQQVAPVEVATDWTPVKSAMDPTTMELVLPHGPGVEGFSLVLSVGIRVGTIGAGGSAEWVRKEGSGKILAMA